MTVSAFVTLFGFMLGHALLETARDALFLTHLPARELPWVYLAIAVLALGASVFQESGARRCGAAILSGWLGAASLVTLAFWIFGENTSRVSLYGLYLWSGTIATVVLVRFWLLLGQQVTSLQAKRLYAWIGMGGTLGAIGGTGLARFLTLYWSTETLVLAASLVLALSSIGPMLMGCAPPAKGPVLKATSLGLDPRPLLASGYARRAALVILLAGLTFTGVDFIFKSLMKAMVAKEDLASVFATVYLALNLVSFGIQLFLVRALVRWFKVHGALAILPALLLLGAGGLVLGGALGAAMLLKLVDGGLRHSLHRTASELLFIPMGERLRSTAKVWIGTVGQRGAQAVASLAILVALSLGASFTHLGAAIAGLSVLWIVASLSLRTGYIDLFRKTLRESVSQPRTRFLELDLSSLESVIAALNSARDDEVRAALRILAEEGRQRLIPALILYHPSADVVIDALEILVETDRQDYQVIAERQMTEGQPEVRAAVLRLLNSLEPSPERLRQHLQDSHAIVSVTALVTLCASGRASQAEWEALAKLATSPSDESRLALAKTIERVADQRFSKIIMSLARDANEAVRKIALGAMAEVPDETYLPVLLENLAERSYRTLAQAALVALGQLAMRALGDALKDEGARPEFRRHLPQAIAKFGSRGAGDILVRQLVEESDGTARYKILRALGQLKKVHPEFELEPEVVQRVTEETIGRAYRLLDWRLVLEKEVKWDTQARRLLVGLLRDKESHAVERLLMLLGLQYQQDDISSIARGLRNRQAKIRSTSQELLEELLVPPLRGAVIGLIDEAPAVERLRQGAGYYRSEHLTYKAVLGKLLEDPGESLRSLAISHIGELGLHEFSPKLKAMRPASGGLLNAVIRTAVDALSNAAGASIPLALPEFGLRSR